MKFNRIVSKLSKQLSFFFVSKNDLGVRGERMFIIIFSISIFTVMIPLPAGSNIET